MTTLNKCLFFNCQTQHLLANWQFQSLKKMCFNYGFQFSPSQKMTVLCVSVLEPGAFLAAQMVKNPLAVWETQVQFLGGQDPWRKEWLPTPVFLPGEFHGQRNLVGYSPWGCKGSDTTEQLTFTCLYISRHHLGSLSKIEIHLLPGGLVSGILHRNKEVHRRA